MKKNIIIAAMIAVCTTSIVASESSNAWFGGLEVGSTSADFKAEVAGLSLNTSDSGGSQSIKVGKYLGNAGRTYAIYTRYNTDSNVDLNSYGVGYDYLFYNSTSFIPFIGVNLGYFNYKASGLDAALAGSGVTSSSDSINISGLTYGLNIGAMYEINKNFEIEAGARFIANNADDTVTFTNGVNSVALKGEIDKIVQYYIGLNYNF